MSRSHQPGKLFEHDSLLSPSVRSQTTTSSYPTQSSELKSQSCDGESLWLRLRSKLIYWSIWFFYTSPIVVPVLLGIVYVPCYRASLTSVEFTVDRRERVTQGGGENTKSYYLVWSKEGEVYCVSDTWSFMSFDSSDRYGRLCEGSEVKTKVAGWRVPFLSWYRNVVEIEEVKLPKS